MTWTVVIAFLLGLVLGGVLVASWGRAAFLARSAGLRTQRDLLRDRVTDLEAALGQDHELSATLGPLATVVSRVEEQVRSLERDRVDQYARLEAQLRQAQLDGQALRAQTSALTGALRSSTSRGSWGEVQLRRVVEHAGMLNRVDFTTQVIGSGPDGSGVRPDMLVHLPGGTSVAVDAKAPLAAFLEASETPEDPRVQEAAAVAHAKAVRSHVDALADKRYWEAFDPGPEIVVCFVPGEAFLAAACSADPALLEHAMSRRVVLATPTTLLALLRTVALSWQTEALSGNARELFTVGRELYSRLGTLGSHTGRLGRSLQRAVDDYNAVVGTLERRVLVSARRMRDLDVTDTDLPQLPVLDEAVPRPLTAVELLEPEHPDGSPRGPGPGPG
jgi:DNA recombination protein RmuC